VGGARSSVACSIRGSGRWRFSFSFAEGIFDPKAKGFVSLADASGNLPDGSSAAAALQNFVPSTYYAVTVH
jgi:hypothetical protein